MGTSLLCQLISYNWIKSISRNCRLGFYLDLHTKYTLIYKIWAKLNIKTLISGWLCVGARNLFWYNLLSFVMSYILKCNLLHLKVFDL